MQVSQSYIIEERQFEDKTIICHIKIVPRFVEYYHGQPKHQTHRWMLPEYWAKFDAKLEILLRDGDLTKDLNVQIFDLNELITVKVKHSKISVDQLKPFIQNSDLWNAVRVFEFIIEFKEEKGKKEKYISFAADEKNEYNNEYEPALEPESSENLSLPYTPSVKPTISPKNDNIFDSSSDTHCNEQLHEETYSPKPLSEGSPDKNSETPCIATHKPMQTLPKIESNDCYQQKVKFKSQKDIMKKDVKDNTTYSSEISPQTTQRRSPRSPMKPKRFLDISSPEAVALSKKIDSATKHKADNAKKLFGLDDDDDDYQNEDSDENSNAKKIPSKPKYKMKRDVKNNKEKCVPDSSPNEVLFSTEISDSSPKDEVLISTDESEKRKRNLTDSEISPQTTLRRSSRSPMKPKRLLDTISSAAVATSKKINPATKHKSANTRKLFRFDDDDYQNEDFDENSNAKKIPSKGKRIQLISPLPLPVQVVKKKKTPESNLNHKKGKKTVMDNWLEKKSTAKLKEKKPTPTIADAGKIKKRKVGYTSPIAYLSKEERAEKMVIEKELIKKNRMLKRALEQAAGPPPAKVKTLSIQALSENEVLDSFENYKTKLDKLFQSNSKNWHTVKGHDGINHVFVISLINEKIQLKMLNKLYSEYEPGGDGIPAHLSLYANALMPEWILCLFMDRHKLTRDEAIAHIKAQEAYKLHIEAKMELESSMTLG